MSNDADLNLSACGCCEDAEATPAIMNTAGLSELGYRVGTHAQFLERMLRAMPAARTTDGSSHPLARLTVRSSDDTTVALLDSVATVADILTFYQERIANEGFLRTATERRSVLELARAIGYELSPGVAASVHLSFTVEDAVGAPLQSLIPQGTPIQSVPPQGKLPQVFETSRALLARAEWNALRPRRTRPADMAVLTDGTTQRLVLLVPKGTVPAGDGVFENVLDTNVHRLGASLTGSGAVDAVEVKRVYLSEAASDIKKGEMLLFAGGEGKERVVLFRRVVEVASEPERKRVRVDIELLAGPSTGASVIGYIFLPAVLHARVNLSRLVFDGARVAGRVVSQAWRERDLQAFIGIQDWNGNRLTRAINARARPDPVEPASGVFAFREKAGFFGNNAPRWSSLRASNAYADAWDAGDKKASTAAAPASPAASRKIWEDSQGKTDKTDESDEGRRPRKAGPHAFLERPVAGIAPGSWIVIETYETAAAWAIHHSNDVARADYGISGRSTALTLGKPTTGEALTELPTDKFFFRDATAHVNSRRIDLVELPIEAPVDAGSTAIELDRMVLGLAVGQAIVLTGERADTPGVDAVEVAFIEDVVHAGGNTTLILEKDGLSYSYVRETLKICANVVDATHGESTQELLGGGNAAVPNQTFTLSKPPLTYVSVPTPRGSQSALVVRVNGIAWNEVPSLYGVPASEQAYVVRIDDDARPRITFGDGVFGARTPTGTTNITASYRSGIGADGEVEANTLTLLRTMPLGLRGVTNALPASGAESPEELADARRNAPRTVLTFERVVSLLDYEDFARTFPGIGKALADELWVGGDSIIHITVAGATGGKPLGDRLENLISALGSASDSSQRFVVSAYMQRYFTVRIQIRIDPQYVAAVVLVAVEESVRSAFSFGTRQFGQPVTPAEILTIVHSVRGVVAVNLRALESYSEEPPPAAGSLAAPAPAPVPARRAYWNRAALPHRAAPAELLLVNPVGITVEEMPA